jgi:hypothetical protein
MGRILLLVCMLLGSISIALPALAGDGECQATKDAYYLGDCAWLPCKPACAEPCADCPPPPPCPCAQQPCACPAQDCCSQPGTTCTDGCNPIPVVEPYCPGYDPNCPLHEEFKLLCCERAPYSLLCCQEREQFKLLCQPECAPCPVKKCKQDTCTTCQEQPESCSSCNS